VNERRTFGPVLLVGLASTGLAAYVGQKPMLRVSTDDLREFGALSTAGLGSAEVSFPLVGALALVALAAWGIVLVTRGRFRQAMAVVAAIAAAGMLATLVVGGFFQDDDAAEDVADQLGLAALADRLPIDPTPSFWVALFAATVSTAAAVATVRLAPGWPEMGSRYDAPATHEPRTSDVPAEERSNLDLWKSMDEGEDPTDR
jgi:uncharacterized membrane protein (TIGR02234 family)